MLSFSVTYFRPRVTIGRKNTNHQIFKSGMTKREPQSRIGLRYDNSVLTTPAFQSKMISKVRVFFLLVLIAVSMYPRTLAFTAGAGNIRGKRGANNIQVNCSRYFSSAYQPSLSTRSLSLIKLKMYLCANF